VLEIAQPVDEMGAQDRGQARGDRVVVDDRRVTATERRNGGAPPAQDASSAGVGTRLARWRRWVGRAAVVGADEDLYRRSRPLPSASWARRGVPVTTSS